MEYNNLQLRQSLSQTHDVTREKLTIRPVILQIVHHCLNVFVSFWVRKEGGRRWSIRSIFHMLAGDGSRGRENNTLVTASRTDLVWGQPQFLSLHSVPDNLSQMPTIAYSGAHLPLSEPLSATFSPSTPRKHPFQPLSRDLYENHTRCSTSSARLSMYSCGKIRPHIISPINMEFIISSDSFPFRCVLNNE